jgi:ATP synthase I chain
MTSGDDLLVRLQRNACLACALFAAIAAAVSGMRAAAAVIGGGLLAGTSFVLIKGAILDVTAFADDSRDPLRRPNTSFSVVKLAGRYALLAFLAYVMIARLRLHPVGLFVGASSFVAVAAVEAARLFRNK